MESSPLPQYLAVLMLFALAMAAGGAMIGLSMLIGKRTGKIMNTAYECGMLPVGDGATRMSVRFYLVAMLCILFAIEVVFMYPWAVVYKAMLADRPRPTSFSS